MKVLKLYAKQHLEEEAAAERLLDLLLVLRLLHLPSEHSLQRHQLSVNLQRVPVDLARLQALSPLEASRLYRQERYVLTLCLVAKPAFGASNSTFGGSSGGLFGGAKKAFEERKFSLLNLVCG